MYVNRAALREVYERALVRWSSDAARIRRAHQLVIDHHLTLNTDGTWTVRSQVGTDAYIVTNETCQCEDFNCRTTRCKHRWAVTLVLWTVEHTRRLAA